MMKNNRGSIDINTALRVSGLSKSFAQKGRVIEAIKSLDFELQSGEFLSVFGPNGCGKTTLVHLLAGILQPDSGTIHPMWEESEHPEFGIVFQDYIKTLMPWRRCLDNITLPLESSNQYTRRERNEIVYALLENLGLELPLSLYPYQMSGGQKQLTCIARAMTCQPKLMLLDEPFASLDFQTRLDMQYTFQRIWIRTGVTTLFISHEIDEAIFLADRLILLTPRPAKVAEIYKIPFERPRDDILRSSLEFSELRNKVLKKFHELVTS